MISRETENLKKKQRQSFFHDVQARLNKIRPTRQDFFCEALVVAFKKTQGFLPYFQDFNSIFQTFPGLENSWENLKTFSRIQDSVRTLSLTLP